MESLMQIIRSFSDTEERSFRSYTLQMGKEKDSLPFRLFTLIRKYHDMFEEDLARELNIKEDNYFYQIKFRLKAIIEDFILKKFVSEDHMHFTQVSNLLNIANYLKYKNLPKIAIKYYYKAERLCEKESDYELLLIVYSQMLSLVQIFPDVPIEEIIEKQNKALEKALLISQLNADYALFRNQLFRANFTLLNSEIVESMEKLLNSFEQIRLTGTESFNIRYKILSILAEVMIYKKDSDSLYDYYAKQYEDWWNSSDFTREHLEKKLRMQYRLCIYLVKQFRFTECESMLKDYWKAIQTSDAPNIQLHALYHRQVVSILYAYTGRINDAIQVSLEVLNKNLVSSRVDVGFIFLFNLAQYYFMNQNFETCLEMLIRLEKKKDFHKYISGRIKSMIEIHKILIFIDLDKKNSARRVVNKLMESKEESTPRTLWFIDILDKILKDPDWKHNREFRMEIDKFYETKQHIIIGDEEHICFNSWLEAQMNNTNYAQEFLLKVKQEEIRLRTLIEAQQEKIEKIKKEKQNTKEKQ